MEEGTLHKVLRIVIIAAIAALLAGMAMIIIHYRSEMNARSRKIASLAPLAAEYEAELNELRRKQETEEKKIYRPEGPGVAVISFLIDDEATFDAALSYGKTYGFTPTILLKTDDETTDAVIDIISGSGLDVILYGRGDYSEENIRSVAERLKGAGLNNTGAFLIRASDDTEANREILRKAGMTTLFLYGDSLTSSVGDDGTAQLNYSYVNKSSYTPANRLASLGDSEQGLLFAIDLVETTVTERQTGEILRVIKDQATAGHIVIGSVADAVGTVTNRTAREKENLDAFEAVQDERNARIAELKAIIAEIYSHWDDTSEISD